jgi:hypothetical protein
MNEESQAVKEYRQAFDEFFKDKPKPKDEEENKKMLEEFFHWYNDARKQSDTGKTPAEMYKDIYGNKPPEPVNMTDDDLNQEEMEDMKEFFDKELWPKLKKDLKEATKKEACFLSFLAGTEVSNNMFKEEMKHAQGTMKNMTPEEVARMIKNGEKSKNSEDNLWSEGSFAETLGSEDIKEKMKTFHKKHDEDMNYNCKKCNTKMSAHNRDWHDNLCDECFNNQYFKDDKGTPHS